MRPLVHRSLCVPSLALSPVALSPPVVFCASSLFLLPQPLELGHLLRGPFSFLGSTFPLRPCSCTPRLCSSPDFPQPPSLIFLVSHTGRRTETWRKPGSWSPAASAPSLEWTPHVERSCRGGEDGPRLTWNCRRAPKTSLLPTRHGRGAVSRGFPGGGQPVRLKYSKAEATAEQHPDQAAACSPDPGSRPPPCPHHRPPLHVPSPPR